MEKHLRLLLVLVTGLSIISSPVRAEEEEAPPPTSWKPAGVVTPPAPTAAAEAEPSIPSPMIQYGEFQLDLHGRIQVLGGLVGDHSHTSNGDVLSRDGFRIRRARLGMSGQLKKNFEYGLELDLIDEDSGGNALLDAFVTFKPVEFAWVRVGAGKLPFSRALMISSGDMQFIERPAWVNIEAVTGSNMLDPGRQVGIAVGGRVSLFNYSAGVYNGSPGFSVGDLNDGLLYVVRLGAGQGDILGSEADFARTGLRWSVGLNGYLDQDPEADVRGGGMDLGVKIFGFSFHAEALWAKSVPVTRPESTSSTLDEFERWGMYVQAGYLYPLSFGGLELAGRFAMMDENIRVDNEGDLWELTVGLNAYLFENQLKLMLNYMKREEMEGTSLENDSILVMMQAMF
jgi:hypothetical protein